jgi:D-glycero-D-manno-heptose 1,7-bisphosphate phosphatase
MRARQGVILVGGLGTRLGALTQTTPKPMIEVAGRPFVEHVIAHLARFGLEEILLLAGYRGEAFAVAYAGREMFGASLSVLVEPEPLGTGGALRFASDRLSQRFLLANGDTFFDADLGDLVGGGDGHVILLRRIEDASRYGTVEVGDDGLVRSFREKVADATGPALINAGCYLLGRDQVLSLIERLPCSFETHVLPRLVADGALRAIVREGYFVDMGLPASLEGARVALLECRRKPVVFLDRDGVLNKDAGYTHRVEDLELVQGAAEAVGAINAAGCYAIVVSNQAGIARGYYPESAARAFNRALRERMMDLGARLDAVYFCPHHPQGTVAGLATVCECRKPKPGLLVAAAKDWPIDTSRSFLVGDMASDVEAARAFGIPGHRFEGGNLAAFVGVLLAKASH